MFPAATIYVPLQIEQERGVHNAMDKYKAQSLLRGEFVNVMLANISLVQTVGLFSRPKNAIHYECV